MMRWVFLLTFHAFSFTIDYDPVIFIKNGMDFYERKEDEGRSIWYQTVSATVTNIVFTKDRYDGVDGYQTGKTYTAVFEIKRRNILSTSYRGKILEVKKLHSLIEAKEKSGSDLALYINIFNDRILVWEVSDLHKEEEWLNCTSTSDPARYSKAQKPKKIIKLYDEETIWQKPRT